VSDFESTRLAIVIVSYNTRDLLRDCLSSLQESLARAGEWLTADVIVMDNASSDGSAAMVARDFAHVHLEALAENCGFTGGNNRALEVLGLVGAGPPLLPTPDYVLLLNPDTRVEGDAVAQLVRFLESTPRAGVCGPALRYGDGRFQHGAFAFPSVAQVALDLFPLSRLPLGARLYASRANGRYPLGLWQAGQPFVVDFILGAALMARAEVLQKLGGLDNGYFMYCEEMDLCLRAAEAGWRVYAVPQAQIVHLEGQSSRQVRWPAFARLWRSRLRFYTLHRAHFAQGTVSLVRVLVRMAMHIGAAGAFREFALGTRNGVDVGAEISARHEVAHVAQQ
jgi:GT2 family glycosyltransferase